MMSFFGSSKHETLGRIRDTSTYHTATETKDACLIQLPVSVTGTTGCTRVGLDNINIFGREYSPSTQPLLSIIVFDTSQWITNELRDQLLKYSTDVARVSPLRNLTISSTFPFQICDFSIRSHLNRSCMKCFACLSIFSRAFLLKWFALYYHRTMYWDRLSKKKTNNNMKTNIDETGDGHDTFLTVQWDSDSCLLSCPVTLCLQNWNQSVCRPRPITIVFTIACIIRLKFSLIWKKFQNLHHCFLMMRFTHQCSGRDIPHKHQDLLYREGWGTGNRDLKTWSGIQSHKVSLGQVRKRAGRHRFTVCNHEAVWSASGSVLKQ